MKFSSLLNLLLIVVTFAGVFRCYQLQTQVDNLHSEFESLSPSYGDFSQEPNSPQIVRLKTNDPMVFQWRVYLPAGYSGVVSDRIGRKGLFGTRSLSLGHGMPWNYPAEFLITQKFKVNTGEGFGSNSWQRNSILTDIQCTNWVASQAGPVKYVSGQGSGGNELVSWGAEYLVDHWSDIVFASDDAGSTSVFEDKVDLLKVTIPEELMEEYLATQGSRRRENENVLKDLYLKIRKVE